MRITLLLPLAALAASGEPMMMQDAMANMAPPIAVETASPPPFNPGVNASMVSVRVGFALSD